MAEVQLPAHGWSPMPHQIEAWDALQNPDVRTTVLAWHRRAGKDELALHYTAIKAMQRVGNYWHMLPQGEQARKAIWDAVNPRTGRVRWKDAFPPEIIEHVDKQSMLLKFKNGSTWQLVGSDNYDSLVGTTPVGIVFSEAALADPAAFGFFSPILLENDGWSLHISSVRGKNHFHRLYKDVEDDPSGFCQLLSAEDTGIFTPMQLAGERRRYISLYGAALGNSMFDQEYLGRWESAVIGTIWGTELTNLEKDGRALPLAYDRRYPVDTSWDIGVGDATVIFFWQTVGNVERLIGWYSASDTGLEHFAEVLADKPYFYGVHIGPHDIAAREWGGNGISRMAQAKKLGIHFERMPNTPKKDAIAASASLINRMEINVCGHTVDDPMDDCAFVVEALRSYRFKFDATNKVMSKNPVHDWASNYADALQQKAIYTMGSPQARSSRRVLQGKGTSDLSKVRLRAIMARDKSSSTGAFG